MLGLLAIVGLGFFLGMRHAADPDHVIAVSTIISREGDLKRASVVGAAWGVGHTLTVLVVGSAMILFRISLPPRVGLAMELVVGLMLIFLGLWSLTGQLSWSAEQVAANPHGYGEERVRYHSHSDCIHVDRHAHEHEHSHNPQRNPVAAMDRWFKGFDMYRWIRPLIIGVVHGLAGSAAIALLVLSTITSVPWAIAYLTVFGLGTVLGMMLITIMIGSTFAQGRKRFAGLGRHFKFVAGLISVAFGLFVAYRIGFVDGLFTAHAHWVPR